MMGEAETDRTNEIVDDRYKILSVLGRGGMAVVYQARDLVTDKDVALKMMLPSTASEKVNLARFEREARAAASLNHPNIVKVLNVGTDHGFPYMVNEFVNGKPLKDILQVRGKFSFLEACDIMYQLSSAVYYAHQHGIIHRDIKPANIYLTKDGTIKLGDFGIAIFLNASHVTKQDKVVGSVHYIAPEILAGDGLPTERSDIYSLGITFFELVTACLPFDHASQDAICRMHIYSRFPSLKKYNAKTPPCIEEIVRKCCQKNPMDRYNSAEELHEKIGKILRNPSLLEKKTSFLYRLFHRKSLVDYEEKKSLKAKKKALRKAAKEARKGKDG